MSYQQCDAPIPCYVWGAEHIDEGSFEQITQAARLPVALAAALMPDAHIGYGLPIGGVLATDNAVIPYAVGVDIACRMRMTVFPESPDLIGQQRDRFKKVLLQQTVFGAGGRRGTASRADHPVLDDPTWDETPFLRSLKGKAAEQLGTSGSGNHFVEWGAFHLEDDNALDLPAGRYLALLSHSGSRGPGFTIANHYSKLAQQLHPDIDPALKHLAWLSLDQEAGQEYWRAMQLAGRYAAANHEVIHDLIARAMKLKPAAVVENHHNFAWEETIPDPQDPNRTVKAVVHRKGATPAGPGVYGIIPGSMGDSGYVVRGKGHAHALNSAAHGAGRVLSRRQAKKTITKTMRDRYLKERGITLLGGGLDEAPQAYKQIDDIIGAQDDLVDIVGRFEPQIVRMDGK